MIWFLVFLVVLALSANFYFNFYRNRAIYRAITDIVNDSELFKNYYPHLPSYYSIVYFHLNVWTKEDLIELAIKRGA
jgi:hypothetical protein